MMSSRCVMINHVMPHCYRFKETHDAINQVKDVGRLAKPCLSRYN